MKKKSIILWWILLLELFSVFAHEDFTGGAPIPEDVGEGCVEGWTCSKWSDCIDDQQTRKCIDSNLCGTTNNKPPESKECVSEEVKEKSQTTEEIKEGITKEDESKGKESMREEKSSFFSGWRFRIIIIFLLLIGVILFVFYKKSKTNNE